MADNYLEKKYEQLRGGPTVIRRVNPSLDTLLHRLAGAASAPVAGAAPSAVSLRSTPPQAVPPLTMPRVAWAAGAVPDNMAPAPADAVRQAQLEAIVRSASILENGFRLEASEPDGMIRVFGADSPHSRLVELGEVILAMRLKAAELGFCSSVDVVREPLRAPQPLLASVRLFR